MKIERLRNKKSKLIFLCGFVIVVVLLITLVFKGSKAKYRSSQIIPLITNKSITNKVPSFTTMGIYLETNKDTAGAEEKGGKYYNKQKKDFIIPEGYKINTTNSYCRKFNSTNESIIDNNVKMYTNSYDEHIFSGISEGDKCYIYLDKGFANPNSIKAQLLTKWEYVGKSITERTDWRTIRTDSGNKVYKALDDDGWSYYLVGNPDNNWVKFGGYYWRIVRINGDGTLRILYSGSELTGPQTTGIGTQLSKNEVDSLSDTGVYAYNKDNYNRAEYVGYWYTLNEQYGLSTPSLIYNIVNTFYSDKLTSVDIDKYIDKDAGFCNDRSLSDGSSFNNEMSFNYGASERVFGLSNYSPIGPTLKCKNQSTDLFTSKGASKGNKKLENSIGLLTIDEVNYAGLVHNQGGSTTNNYLYTGLKYWTMTPMDFIWRSDISYSSLGLVFNDGSYVHNRWLGEWYGIRPVINLKKDITFSKGNGLSTNPFEI